MKKQSNKRKYLYIFGLVFGGILLFYQVYLSINSIVNFSLSNTVLIHFFYAFIFAFLAIFIQILAWYVLLEESFWKNKKNFIKLVKGYTLSFIPRYLPGTVWGYLSRSEWLFQKFSISYNKSNSVSILELASTITANLLIIFIWINITYFKEKFYLGILLLFFFPLLIWLIISGGFRVINYSKINFFNFGTIEFTLGLSKNWFLSVFLFLIHWFFLANSLNEILLFLGNQSLFIIDSMFSTCISWLTGFLIFFVPAGIGIREATLFFVLKDFFLVNFNLINIAVVLFRFLSILAEVSWIMLKFVKNKNNFQSS